MLVVVALAALSAVPAALACRVDTTLDKPIYPPGSAAMITGFASGPGAETARTVRFTWGEGGPLLGEAPVGADGAISYSFTVPTDLATGSHPIYAEAFDASGADITPLPGSMLLIVEAPPVPAASASDEDEQLLRTRVRLSVLASAPASRLPAEREGRTVEPRPAPAPAPSPSVVPQAPVAAAALAAEYRAERLRPKPVSRTPERRLPAAPVTPARGARTTTAQSTAKPATPGPTKREGLLGIAMLFLLLVTAVVCLAAFAWRSRRKLRIEPAATADEIEAELQKILAEEHARRSELVGRN